MKHEGLETTKTKIQDIKGLVERIRKGPVHLWTDGNDPDLFYGAFTLNGACFPLLNNREAAKDFGRGNNMVFPIKILVKNHPPRVLFFPVGKTEK